MGRIPRMHIVKTIRRDGSIQPGCIHATRKIQVIRRRARDNVPVIPEPAWIAVARNIGGYARCMVGLATSAGSQLFGIKNTVANTVANTVLGPQKFPVWDIEFGISMTR